SPTPPADILIPARNLSKLADILPSQGPVQVMVTPQKNQVEFHLAQGEQIDFVSRLIEVVFPPYKKIIRREHTRRADADTRRYAAGGYRDHHDRAARGPQTGQRDRVHEPGPDHGLVPDDGIKQRAGSSLEANGCVAPLKKKR